MTDLAKGIGKRSRHASQLAPDKPDYHVSLWCHADGFAATTSAGKPGNRTALRRNGGWTLSDAIHSRRSIRSYQSNLVDRNLIESVIWDAAPVLILISGELEDCCRAAQNLMLSAHARGLGTCWVGSPLLWLRTEEVKAELQVPAALTPNVAMCLGYANAVPPISERDRPPVIWVS